MDIKTLRKQKGMTMMKLAKEVGVSYTTIQLWENEVTKPNKENLLKLFKVLEVAK